MKFPRSFYARPYQLTEKIEELGVEIYRDETGCILLAFAGKAQKPALHYRYRTREAADERAKAFIASRRAGAEYRAKRAAERKAWRHTLKVGDVLKTHWGYDQTNVEFFQVTALVGSCMVEIRELARDSEETGFMAGQCKPRPGEFIGEPARHKVCEGNSIRFASYRHATLFEPEAIVDGRPVYRSSYWSSYA